jgi:hypothetical protein
VGRIYQVPARGGSQKLVDEEGIIQAKSEGMIWIGEGFTGLVGS